MMLVVGLSVVRWGQGGGGNSYGVRGNVGEVGGDDGHEHFVVVEVVIMVAYIVVFLFLELFLLDIF